MDDVHQQSPKIGGLIDFLESFAPERLAELRSRFADEPAALARLDPVLVLGDESNAEGQPTDPSGKDKPLDVELGVARAASQTTLTQLEKVHEEVKLRITRSNQFHLVGNGAAALTSAGVIGLIAGDASQFAEITSSSMVLVWNVALIAATHLRKGFLGTELAATHQEMAAVEVEAHQALVEIDALAANPGAAQRKRDIIKKATELTGRMRALIANHLPAR